MWQSGKGGTLGDRTIEVTSHQPLEIFSNEDMEKRQMVASGGTQMSSDSAKAELWPRVFGYFACLAKALPLRIVGRTGTCQSADG